MSVLNLALIHPTSLEILQKETPQWLDHLQKSKTWKNAWYTHPEIKGEYKKIKSFRTGKYVTKLNINEYTSCIVGEYLDFTRDYSHTNGEYLVRAADDFQSIMRNAKSDETDEAIYADAKTPEEVFKVHVDKFSKYLNGFAQHILGNDPPLVNGGEE